MFGSRYQSVSPIAYRAYMCLSPYTPRMSTLFPPPRNPRSDTKLARLLRLVRLEVVDCSPGQATPDVVHSGRATRDACGWIDLAGPAGRVI